MSTSGWAGKDHGQTHSEILVSPEKEETSVRGNNMDGL